MRGVNLGILSFWPSSRTLLLHRSPLKTETPYLKLSRHRALSGAYTSCDAKDASWRRASAGLSKVQDELQAAALCSFRLRNHADQQDAEPLSPILCMKLSPECGGVVSGICRLALEAELQAIMAMQEPTARTRKSAPAFSPAGTRESGR